MLFDSECQGRLTVGNDKRITRVGHFLRKYKIDELPQLMDVFIGKMSMVGPRPEVQEFIDEYPDAIRKKVLSVRPGLTDRASIEMVDENAILAKYPDPRKAYIEEVLPIKQKFYLEYIKNQSLVEDINIIFLTVKRIFLRL
jgi:lipopolysaccharide/colanic/teichoic acid biosynthesis glycosyltransferase